MYSRILVDADGILFKVGFAAASYNMSLDQAYSKYEKALLELAEMGTESDSLQLFYTGKGRNYRKDFGKEGAEYKAHRKLNPIKPLYIDELRDEFKGKVSDPSTEGEADDLIAMEMHNLRYDPSVLIVSNDKDLLQISGTHLRSNAMLVHVTPYEGKRNFYKQLLIGDTSDNIPGIKGVGNVTAGAILKSCQFESQLFENTLKAYQKYYGKTHTEDEIAEMICNRGNMLYLKKTIDDRWSPPL